jgi:hypothetical protein
MSKLMNGEIKSSINGVQITRYLVFKKINLHPTIQKEWMNQDLDVKAKTINFSKKKNSSKITWDLKKH